MLKPSWKHTEAIRAIVRLKSRKFVCQMKFLLSIVGRIDFLKGLWQSLEWSPVWGVLFRICSISVAMIDLVKNSCRFFIQSSFYIWLLHSCKGALLSVWAYWIISGAFSSLEFHKMLTGIHNILSRLPIIDVHHISSWILYSANYFPAKKAQRIPQNWPLEFCILPITSLHKKHSESHRIDLKPFSLEGSDWYASQVKYSSIQKQLLKTRNVKDV